MLTLLGCCGAVLPAAAVPRFATPAWEAAGKLELREEPGAAGSLLLRQTPTDKTYRYSPGTSRLEPVAGERWRANPTPVADCDAQVPPPPRLMLIDPKSGVLKSGDRAIVLQGGTAVALRMAPSGAKVAVLSAGGRRKESLLPFIGQGIEGPHYHQVFSLPGASAVDRPQRLPFESGKVGITLCWSPSERFVVYYDVVFSHLAIVVVDPEGAINARQ